MSKMKPKQKEALVKELYEKYPYPLRTEHSPKELSYFAKWLASIFGETPSFWKGKTILGLGCGTGELACALALSGATVTAIDFSSTSIKHAKELSKKLGTTKETMFLEKNILKITENEFPNKFDVVVALGSLHHTINARKGFSVACANAKENGLVIIGLYNKYSRFRHRIKRAILWLFCGSNIEKRISFGEKHFGVGGNKSHSADKYGQVHESYHSVNELLKWFKEEELEFVSSKPKFETPFIDELKWLARKDSAFFVMVGRKVKC